MIQRLLRGRLLYVVLGTLTLCLYVRMRPARMLEPPEMLQRVPMFEETMRLWPEELKAAAFKELAEKEPRIAGMVALVTSAMMAMGVGGLAVGLWGLWTGRVRSLWHFSAPPLPRWSFGELGRITILIVLMASLLPFVRMAIMSLSLGVSIDAHLWLTVAMVAVDGFAILTVLAFAVGKGRSLWETLGISTATRQVWPAIVVGFRGYLIVFPWLFILLALIMALAQVLGMQPPIEPIQELVFQEDRPAVLALTVLLACVVGPVAEELFFRGVVYPTIRQRTSRLVAMLISGAIFSFIHTNLIGFLPIMVLGCLLAHLYERTGSLASPVAVHVLHNVFLMSLALSFRQVLELI